MAFGKKNYLVLLSFQHVFLQWIQSTSMTSNLEAQAVSQNE